MVMCCRSLYSLYWQNTMNDPISVHECESNRIYLGIGIGAFIQQMFDDFQMSSVRRDHETSIHVDIGNINICSFLDEVSRIGKCK